MSIKSRFANVSQLFFQSLFNRGGGADLSSSSSNPVSRYIAEICESPKFAGRIAYRVLLPASPPVNGECVRPWPAAIASLLNKRGARLYSHQARAADYIRAGGSVVVATPTASGKSLIYNLPTIETFLKDPDSRALYLFPLKALAQDQALAFKNLVADWPVAARPTVELYDGDTPEKIRSQIRDSPPAVLMTNPEMLHLSLLPYHEKWATFIANLNYIVADEAHAYRGVFGAHMAQIFRRLNRICARYGASPSYVFCTATLGNPAELAGTLMDGEATLIDQSGAPQGPRNYLFVNPESSAASSAIELLRRALELNLRVIVYCKSRRMTELVSVWAGAESGPWKNKISAYRAGFLPEERREIEARMASGDLLAVVSTSALELGIDIGGLDVCVLVGYPGTIMQTLQRGGRVGRSGRESAVIVVGEEDALDQYFMRHPEDFFARSPEKAIVNPDNEVVLARHLECAARETPLRIDEPWLARPGVRNVLRSLTDQGLLALSADKSQWRALRPYPQRDVDLRGAGQSYSIENEGGRIIGSIDGYRAWMETHPGAVYIHRGRNYLIDEIDDGRRRIKAREAKTAWFTRVRSRKNTDILEEYERISFGRCPVFRGRLRITDTITGYEKRSVSGQRLLGITPLDAPPRVFETEGLWIVVPDSIRKEMESQFIHFMGSIHALEHATIGLLPLEVMADRNDFGGISLPLHPQLGLAAVFVYDSLPGGAGLTRAAFPNTRRLLESVKKLIDDCDCEDGCPSCVQSPKCGAGNRPLSKSGASFLLGRLLADGDEGDEIRRTLRISPPLEKPAPSPLEKPVPARPKKPSPPDDPLKALLDAVRPGDAIQILYVQDPVEPAPRRLDVAPPAPLISLTKIPKNYVVFDVETRRSAYEVGGWHKIADMGVSVATLYDSGEDKFFNYEQDQLAEMFEKMRSASLVIGFNSLRFDYKALEPFARENRIDLYALPSLDLLQKFYESARCRVSLDNLGMATLAAGKSASGIQALNWWKEGKIDKIAEYCQKDVELTRDLYLYGMKAKCLYYRAKTQALVRVGVDFSHI